MQQGHAAVADEVHDYQPGKPLVRHAPAMRGGGTVPPEQEPGQAGKGGQQQRAQTPVSYTHLTLPTKLEV